MPFFPWKPKNPDVPSPPLPAPPEPDDANPARAAWLRALYLLRQIDKNKLGAAFVTVPVIVFFVLSGVVLWGYVLCRGAWKFVKSVFA